MEVVFVEERFCVRRPNDHGELAGRLLEQVRQGVPDESWNFERLHSTALS